MKNLLLCCLVFVAIPPGCTPQKQPGELDPLCIVEGRVFLDGEPLTKGEVSFAPDHEKGNPYQQWSRGDIQPDGTYRLETFKKPGAQPGWYKVQVLATVNVVGERDIPIWMVHEKYTKVEKTDLSVEVTANPSPGAYDLKVVGPEE